MALSFVPLKQQFVFEVEGANVALKSSTDIMNVVHMSMMIGLPSEYLVAMQAPVVLLSHWVVHVAHVSQHACPRREHLAANWTHRPTSCNGTTTLVTTYFQNKTKQHIICYAVYDVRVGNSRETSAPR